MTYAITYSRPVDDVFGEVERSDKNRTLNKLYEIAANEYRQPRDFDFELIPQHEAAGRFRVGDSLRAFATVDDASEVIRVYEVCPRENLY